MPELLDGTDVDTPSGTYLSTGKRSLSKLADSLQLPEQRPPRLSPRQVATQQLIGSLKFIEQLHPQLSLVLHRLSCVMSCPPEAAWDVARGALKAAYEARDVGITYGGPGLAASPRLGGSLAAHIDLTEPAPPDLEAHADATWGERNVYGLIITYAGAAVLHQTKKIHMLCDSSMENEVIGSAKAAEAIAFAHEIMRALGILGEHPTLIGTDNMANLRVASGAGHPARSLHFLRRYHALKQRVKAGEVELRHVPDVSMPADFLTKWIGPAKLEQSIRYATNSASRAPTSEAPSGSNTSEAPSASSTTHAKSLGHRPKRVHFVFDTTGAL